MINSLMQTIILKMTSWILLSNRLLTVSFQSKWYLFPQNWEAGKQEGREEDLGNTDTHLLFCEAGMSRYSSGRWLRVHRTSNSNALAKRALWQLSTQQL